MCPHLASSGPGCGSGWVRAAKFKVNCILPSVCLLPSTRMWANPLFIKRLFQSNQLPVTFNTSSSAWGRVTKRTLRGRRQTAGPNAPTVNTALSGVGSPTGSRPRGIDARQTVRSTVASGKSEFSERVFHASASEGEPEKIADARCSDVFREMRRDLPLEWIRLKGHNTAFFFVKGRG